MPYTVRQRFCLYLEGRYRVPRRDVDSGSCPKCGTRFIAAPCRWCKGTGQSLLSFKCRDCGGTGKEMVCPNFLSHLALLNLAPSFRIIAEQLERIDRQTHGWA